jgi:hypothetical protein
MLDDSIFDADFSQYNKHFSQLVKIENIFENDYTTIEDQEKQLKTVNHKKVFRKPNLFGVYYRSSQNSSKGSILSGSKTIHKVNSIHFNEQNETLQLVFWNTIRTTFFPGLIPQSSPCPAELQTYQTTIHSLNETKNKQRIHQNY